MSWQSYLSGLFEAASDVWRWSLDRIRPSLAQPLREFGWHDEAGMFRLADDGAVEAVGIRQASWMGETRLVAADEAGCKAQARHVFILPETRQFRTTLSLSPMAARRGRAALELRQDRFMPLAGGRGQFAYEVGELDGEGRLAVEIAVARTASLDEVEALQTARVDWEIAGALSPDGRTRFLLAQRRQGAPTGWLKPAALYGLLVLVLLVWQERWQDAADAQADARAQQAVSVRYLREAATDLGAVEARRELIGRPVYLGDILQTLSELPDTLSENEHVQRARLGSGRQLDLVVTTGEGDTLETRTLTVPVAGGGE